MPDTITDTDTILELSVPNLWSVTILNDDFTPMDFVIDILTEVFNKNADEALEMTLAVHEKGSAIVGTYTKDIAQTKVGRASKLATEEGHPLRLLTEPS